MTTTACVECNSELSADAGFCPECGFPAEADTANCPECLHLVDINLQACPECGCPLEELRLAHGIAPAGAASSRALGTAERRGKIIDAVPAGDDFASQVLHAQVESLNELTDAIGQLIENSNSTAIKELVASLGNFVNSAENTNNDMLSDLITNIGKFVESSEKIKDDMVNSMREQNLIATSAMQEIVTSFSEQLKTASAGIQEAQKATLAEMSGVVQQVKAAASIRAEESAGGSDGSPYVLYLCVVMVIFTIVNFCVTAYVVRLVK